jgi:hypothetical protein
MRINFAIMDLSQDITNEQGAGIKNMISSVPAPPQSGYGDILDIRA